MSIYPLFDKTSPAFSARDPEPHAVDGRWSSSEEVCVRTLLGIQACASHEYSCRTEGGSNTPHKVTLIKRTISILTFYQDALSRTSGLPEFLASLEYRREGQVAHVSPWSNSKASAFQKELIDPFPGSNFFVSAWRSREISIKNFTVRERSASAISNPLLDKLSIHPRYGHLVAAVKSIYLAQDQ